MSSPNLVPRGDLTGSIGTASKRWLSGSFGHVTATTFVGTDTSLTGSFTGSFTGDGSNLLNVTSTTLPAGSDGDIQFNDGDTAASGSTNFTFNKSTNRVELTGSFYADSITGSFSGTFPAISSSYIDLAPTANGDAPAWLEGRVYYDVDQGSLIVYNDETEIALNVGQEFYVRSYNNSGATISNGTPVFISGSQGDYPYIWAASSATHSVDEYDGNKILGVATHDIENNTAGYITENGLVRGIDLSAFNAGDVIYASSSAGELTNVKPLFPYEPVQVGFVVRASNNGILFVKPEEPIHLDEIALISGSSVPNNGDLWVYDSAVGAFKNTNVLPDVVATGSFQGTFASTGAVTYTRTEVSQSSYTVASGDYLLGVTHTTGSATTIQLDLATNVKDRHYVIKDEGLNAKNKNITLQPSGSDLIEGDTSFVIAINGASVNIYSNGTNWFVY